MIKARPTGARPSDHPTRRLVAVAAALALLVAACGDDDADGDAAGITVEDGTDDATDATGATDGGSDTDADVGASDTQADDATDDDTGEAGASGDAETDEPAPAGGPAEHRPPPAGEPDCAAVTAAPPGAVISFPGDADPGWLDAGPGPVTVEVAGCSDSFEATIQYDAFHGQDTTPTLSGFTEGGTLGNWGAFSFEETYWTPGDWTVVIFVDDAASGDRVEYDEVTFTVG